MHKLNAFYSDFSVRLFLSGTVHVNVCTYLKWVLQVNVVTEVNEIDSVWVRLESTKEIIIAFRPLLCYMNSHLWKAEQ